jgi:HSP20 family protein
MFSNNTTIPLPLNNDTEDAASIFFSPQTDSQSRRWEDHESDGQLSIDVVNTEDELIVIATMAGASPEDVELHLHNDFLTIRGKRQSPVPLGSEHFYQECYWGKFSRTIVLPVDVKSELARAEYRSGLLIVYLPKTRSQATIPIMVIED